MLNCVCVCVCKCKEISLSYTSNREANLTHQYYALFGKEHITWMGLAENWRKLLTQQNDPEVLEKGTNYCFTELFNSWKRKMACILHRHSPTSGAILLSQWMNPCKEISASFVQEQLDGIAEEIATEFMQGHVEEARQLFKDADPSSQSHKSEDSASTTSKLRGLELPTEVVLDAINNTLYNRLHFSPPTMDQYYNLENSFIDRVSKLDVSYDCHHL